MSEKLKSLPSIDLPQQPQACKGCLWGKWVGTSQVCSLPRCVPEQLTSSKKKPLQRKEQARKGMAGGHRD